MNAKPKKLAASGMAAATVLIVFLISYTQFTSAQQLQTLSELPIGTDGILTVKSLVSNENVSHNNEIEMIVESQDDGVIFKAINKEEKNSDLGVDVWKISVDGTVLDINPPPVSVADTASLKAMESRVIGVFNLDEYSEEFEQYPGIYDITLLGFDREYSSAKMTEYDEEEIEFESQDLAKYVIKATMIVGYDENAIKAKGHLLKATNTQVALNSVIDPFIVGNDEKRTVGISIINNEDHPVSALVGYLSSTTMNVEHTKATGYERVSEYEANYCEILMPGESKIIQTYTLGKDMPPLGAEKGLAGIIGDGGLAEPGTYIMKIAGGTKPCSVDGEDAPGMFFENMVAFEVI